MTTSEKCFCGKPATQYIDSDSFQYQEYGQPVCDDDAEGMDPVETPIPIGNFYTVGIL